MFSWGIAVATGSDAALEWRVESLRRTPAAVRETIATNWALEIDELVESVVTLEVNVPLSLIKYGSFLRRQTDFVILLGAFGF